MSERGIILISALAISYIGMVLYLSHNFPEQFNPLFSILFGLLLLSMATIGFMLNRKNDNKKVDSIDTYSGIGNPFKQSGVILIIIGFLDIGLMAYCIKNQISYSSSFNIFAVIVGIFLLRGSIKTARIVRWFSVFYFCSFCLFLMIFPVLAPVSLLLTAIKLYPWVALLQFIMTVLFLWALIHIYFQLSSVVSLEFLKRAGFNIGKPKSAGIAAIVLVIILSITLIPMMKGESSKKAINLAMNQLGDGYQYYVSQVNFTGHGRGSANVIAYNNQEIKSIRVSW